MKNRIKILRAMHNLTQEQLAEYLDISRPALSNIETGESVPGGRLMIKIANHFGIPVERIFFENDVLQEERS